MEKTVYCEGYPVVSTVSGKLRGIESDGVIHFRGIDYAYAERFELPQPVKPWEGIKDAVIWGNTCPNLEVPLSTIYSAHRYWPADDHCQNLNVWTTSLNPMDKKPVMLWIHGGGYFGGSSIDEAITEGDNLAKTNEVVVVSINHRLNCLGFLDLIDFKGFEDSANLGMSDIVAALIWVKDNIIQFGGDPENITLFGQSGGGGKIMTLMQMPSADGMYHKVIIQSGVMTPRHTRQTSKEHARRTVRLLSLTEKSIDNIRTIPYAKLADAAEKAANQMGTKLRDISEPRSDGNYILGDYLTHGFRDEVKHIPIMVGSCAGELSLFDPNGLKSPEFSKSELSELTYSEKVQRLDLRFGEKAAQAALELKNAYPKLDPLYALVVDSWVRIPTLKYAKAISSFSSTNVYNYVLSYVVPLMEGKLAWHGADLPFTFANLAKSETMRIGGEMAVSLMQKMSKAWIEFAKKGDPNHNDLPRWLPFTEAEQQAMIFDVDCFTASKHDENLLEIISNYRTM